MELKKREKNTVSIEGTLCDVVAHDATSWTVYIKDRILAVTHHSDSEYQVLDQTTGDNADPYIITLLSPIAIEAVKQSISIPQ